MKAHDVPELLRPAALLLVALLTTPWASGLAQDAAPDTDAKADADRESEDEAYAVHTVSLPEDLVLEVGGLLPLGDDAVLVCTRRGEVWRVDGAGGDAPTFTLWADGLQEPLGLLDHEGWIWCAQRGELSRMRDADGDGRGDTFVTVCDDWTVSGNYHEYNFGPRLDAEGHPWITTNRAFGDQPFGQVDWRGWALRILPDGTMDPVCAGLRSPAGLERSPWGEMFYTDNQGEWCGASKLSHLEVGDFHGHPFGMESCKLPRSRVESPGELPDGVLMPEAARTVPGFKLPAVWFPYDKTGRSPSGMDWDQSDGAFGPFDGQLFVGDQYGALVLRVCLEEVEGVWQGACLRFREGLASGVIRVRFDDAGDLWVGMSDRGWASLGDKEWGLQRISWTGHVPFEMHTVSARRDGFRLTFTEPVDPATAADPASYDLQSFTYRYHSPYGSAEVDARDLTVRAAVVAADGLSVDLQVPRLREGYVHEIAAPGVRADDGRALLHDTAWYTLQKIPGGRRPFVVLVAAEPELRSEETLPALAHLLERDHDAETLVLHALDGRGRIDPAHPSNVPGLEALHEADLVVLAMRDRALPADQLDQLLTWLDAPCPVVSLRGSLRPLRYADGPHVGWNDELPDALLGSVCNVTQVMGTRTLVAPVGEHPILRGVDPFLSPLPLACLDPLEVPEDGAWEAIVNGQAVRDETRGRRRSGRAPSGPSTAPTEAPIVVASRAGGRRVVTTTLGHPDDLVDPAGRRLLLQSMLWALGAEDRIPPAGCDVSLEVELDPAPVGIGRHRRGRMPDASP